MSLKIQLQILQPNGVRWELRAASGTVDRVKESAMNWRRTHLGRYLVMYEESFGDSPSVALGRTSMSPKANEGAVDRLVAHAYPAHARAGN